VTKLEEPPEERRTIVKGDFGFIDEVYDLYMRHSLNALGI
jgi:hypothetical protein